MDSTAINSPHVLHTRVAGTIQATGRARILAVDYALRTLPV
ncbi:hypothetical protein [Kutzneria albida]|uniref:Uncharacterized protein n=1 Tax=Kutzneria albida DSM 43870 TaxID=1449976 RepID=W5WCX6_9PSEU|nr:hypothetical protein [Kutzneria albida]AHH98687.1 hypothetical protein KALB_5325 [Kutzneria albida DSM 43870]